MDYRAICQRKHDERLQKLLSLPQANESLDLSPQEQRIHSLNITELVQECASGRISKREIACIYSKKLLAAQARLNCVSDVLITNTSIQSLSSDSPSAPLLGVPISVKDCIDVAGHPSTIGFARYAFTPAPKDSPLTKLMLDAGCILLAKSTLPTSLFSVSTTSPLFSGPTLNPHNPLYGVGASTGGGAALVASRAALIELGSDIAGSIRFPAHFAGCYGLKGSVGRWPASGNQSSMKGLIGVETLGGPLTGTMEDLETVWRAVVGMKPWTYDEHCIPLPWREDEYKAAQTKKLKWGVIWTDGVLPPSPPCRRALAMCVDALREQGHEVIDLTPHTPSIPSLLEIGYNLVFGDGGEQISSQLIPGEGVNRALQTIISLMQMPRWLCWIIGFTVRIFDFFGLVPNPVRDARSTSEHRKGWWSRLRSVSSYWAPQLSLLRNVHKQTVVSTRELASKRDEFRQRWQDEVWEKHGVDFLITPVAAFSAVREGGERIHPLSKGGKGEGRVGKGEDAERMGLPSAGYAFVFSLLDYTAGVLPITTVDRDLDALYPPYPLRQPLSLVQADEEVYKRRLPESLYKRYESKTPGLPTSLTPLPTKTVEERYESEWECSNPYSSLPKHGNGCGSENDHADGHGHTYPNGNGHPHGNAKSNGHDSSTLASQDSSFPPYYALNSFSNEAYSVYDSNGMHGLPIGIQVVGRRLEEEKVLSGMNILQGALKALGWGWSY